MNFNYFTLAFSLFAMVFALYAQNAEADIALHGGGCLGCESSVIVTPWRASGWSSRVGRHLARNAQDSGE